MINKKTISVNILFSIVQIFITGLSYYFLYKFLLQKAGTNLMGVWAIVLSVSSTANIASFGIGAGVVRQTAVFIAQSNKTDINKLIHTSLIFLGLVIGAVCILIYIIAPYWIRSVISPDYNKVAMDLIPFSLGSLFLNSLGSVFLSCLDGFQKNYLRSIIYILSFAVLLGFSYYLVPRFALKGIAYAQIIQAVFIILSGIISVKYIFRSLSFFPLTWNKPVFKKIFSFGIQEQIISICQLCFDPFTKSVLSSYGNLSMVTYYEMANRFVTQLRGFIISANQVLIPVFTSVNEKSEQMAKELYQKVFTSNFILSILYLTVTISCVVPVAVIWIGEYNVVFVFSTILLALAYWSNIVMSPSYFSNMGEAKLRDNVLGNIIIAILNVLLCFVLGYFYKGYGVISGWVFAMATGSFFILISYHKKKQISYLSFLSAKQKMFVVVTLVCSMATGILLFYLKWMNIWLLFLIAGTVIGLASLFVLLTMPPFNSLLQIIKAKFRN